MTIVVPCRDEAWRLPECLDALTRQTYADATILVVDDGSSDGSAEIAAELLGSAGQVVIAPPKPDDWTGKSWACQVGAENSAGDLLLFVDADTVLVPVALRILVEQLDRRRLDMLSGLTRFAMPTRGERVAVPGFPMLLFGFVPVWLTGLLRGRPSRAAFAYGPLMLVRRDAYEATGGHGATAGQPPRGHRPRSDVRPGRAGGSGRCMPRPRPTRHHVDAEPRSAPGGASPCPTSAGRWPSRSRVIGLETLAFLVPIVLPIIALAPGGRRPDARRVIRAAVPAGRDAPGC